MSTQPAKVSHSSNPVSAMDVMHHLLGMSSGELKGKSFACSPTPTAYLAETILY